VRHRQTKGAATDMFDLQPPRHTSTLHHLLELSGLVEARVIDLDGVYDPCRPNDRRLLGMKGSKCSPTPMRGLQ
jgi:hypothetical protein